MNSTQQHAVGLRSAGYVARRLGVSKARVYELARTRLIPSVRIGRQVRFDDGAIEQWIESGGSALEGGWRRGGG